MQKILSIIIFLFLINSCKNTEPKTKFIFNEGAVYGTLYHISYESPDGKDLHTAIEAELNRLDNSLSPFNPESVISKVNTNKNVVLDDLFLNVFNRAKEIYRITNGAFDPTVAPLVNVWGFGFRGKETINQPLLDSIMDFVGFDKVAYVNGMINKDDQRLMLDFSAIAKGYAVDVVGDLLKGKGCLNYMVEIGGEVVAHGLNKEGNIWRIGINEPNDNEPILPSELQAILSVKNMAVATSGNYRNFYIEDGKKYAHTIDPHSGYPVQHSLLSATVVADNCMTADAYATALMVLGVDEAQKLALKLDDIEVFLIYADKKGKNKVVMSPKFNTYLYHVEDVISIN